MKKALIINVDEDNFEEKSPLLNTPNTPITPNNLNTPSPKKGRPKKIKSDNEEEIKEYIRNYHRQRYHIKKEELKANCNKNSKKYRESYKILLQIASEKELNNHIWTQIKEVLGMTEDDENDDEE